MSRTLILLAAALFALLSLAPLAAMALRVDPADFQALVTPRTLDLLGRTVFLGLSVSFLAVLV
ncbi:MAG: iron ABC transporter permease, partial [bacterium]